MFCVRGPSGRDSGVCAKIVIKLVLERWDKSLECGLREEKRQEILGALR